MIKTINALPERGRDTLGQIMTLRDSPGVYIIECQANAARYAGATRSVCGRAQGHFSRLNSENHEVPLLQIDWGKFGSDQFVFWFRYAPTESLDDLEKQVTLLTNSLEDCGGYNKSLLMKRWVSSRIRDSETKLMKSGKFIPLRSALCEERLKPDYIRTFCQRDSPLSAQADMQIGLEETQRRKQLRQLMSGFQRIEPASFFPHKPP